MEIVVIGGGSGMGYAFAELMVKEGADICIVGRSAERLEAAATKLRPLGNVRLVIADATRERDVVRLFDEVAAPDHIVCTAADVTGAYRLLPELDVETMRRALDSKVVAPLLIAKHGGPKLRPGGSITLTSGIAAYRPAPKGSLVAAINGALESIVYALALEFAPLRVNAVSPGWVDTEIWDQVAGDGKSGMLAAMAKRLPVGRIGQPGDVALAIKSVIDNGFITGTVAHVDGGQRLV